ncbi:MAG: EamA family transporter RarD [Hyphomicrobiaceae bacterium]|nr:EamA family transporter RarD [Hyphomicrobiaceae bacterium]
MSDEQQKDIGRGVSAALGAYVMWGLFPLMFRALEAVPSTLIVAHRIIWSLFFVYAILYFQKRLGEVWAAMRDPRTLLTIFAATLFLSVNWLVYVWSVETGQVLATSFGYYINPLVNVLLGMVFLGERQNRQQWVAIAIAAAAVALQAQAIGGLPWISLTLAGTFGVYGFIRKTVNVRSSPGLAVETLVLFPFAIGYAVYSASEIGTGFYTDPWSMFWLIATGPATAGALMFFAYGARQLRLTTIGMIQYLAPSMQFLIAVFLFHEEINAVRLISFALIWMSLVVYTHDSLRQRRKRRLEREIVTDG